MICEDQNFVTNVMVIDSTREMVIMSVISQSAGATTDFYFYFLGEWGAWTS